MRLMLTDTLWDILEPLVQQARRYKCGAKPQLTDRMFFEALLYIGRTGIPWRDLPGDFGRWEAVYNRFRRWIASRSLQQLFQLLTDKPEFGEVRRVLIDSTIVRAHQHAAGAPRRKKRLVPNGRRGSRAWAAVEAGIPVKSS
jgi:putative transposase